MDGSYRDLFRAGQDGDLPGIRAAIDAGADPDERDSRGRTALMLSAQAGRRDSVQALLTAGATVTLQDMALHTALHFAAEGGHTEALELLQNADAGAEAACLRDSSGLLPRDLLPVEDGGAAAIAVSAVTSGLSGDVPGAAVAEAGSGHGTGEARAAVPPGTAGPASLPSEPVDAGLSTAGDSAAVFLGGACGATTWRGETAVPQLLAAGVSFFNPQAGDGEWTPAMVERESRAKESAGVLLFVITGDTRAVSSCVEVAEWATALAGTRRRVVLVVHDVSVGATIGGEVVGEAEASDLNRGRHYLRDVAERRGAVVRGTVEDAVLACIELARDGEV